MKEIQEQRMKKYFIDACKALICGEGYKAVSVRTIAEQAGYSSATLYNYFSDTKNLVRLCVDEFIEEMKEFVFSVPTDLKGKDAVRHYAKRFIMYFVQYPDIFHVIYTEDIYEIRRTDNFRSKTLALFDEIFSRSEMESRKEAAQLELSLTALLLFYLNRFSPRSYQDFMAEFDETLGFILANCR